MKTTSFLKLTAGFFCMTIALSSCNKSANLSNETKKENMGTTTETMEVKDFATDPHIDKGTKEFLKVLNTGGTPVEQLSKEDARNVLVKAQASVKVDVSGIDESEKTITADGHTVKLNIVRPAGVKEKLPVFIFLHGGGWILGDYPTHKRLVRDLVVLSGCAAVFVNYTPSPEAKYPQPLNEIYAATKWVAEHGDEINVDGKKLAVVGNSVGGNMAIATGLMAKEKKGPEIKLMVLLWPVADSGFDTDSYKMYAKDRFLTAPLMKWMFDQYTTDPKQRKEIYVSPLQATVEQLQGLPPTSIHVAENDILRDEGEALGRKLDEAGVDVSTIRYNGVIHDFGMLNALAELPTTRIMLENAAAKLKKSLK
ncbi:acetyl esterase/lipase [Flavobacterium sp. CG_23.5]|uniref:alpha/beta hydrolase n=1 Tax=Flavobacterium sp. CG_23.5 TaxID=2760708 RepID=UPI001AEAF620|nr:alpha/beta hydrolase [Flavobacterium sp. CG_23.5]MBP2283680.1 acetyl esterase/lipase [Flavobacterium sp. CG_23.5]